MQKTKSITLGVLTLAAQSAVWWFLRQAFNSSSASNWVWLTVLASVAISFATFFFLTNRMRWLSETIIVLSALVYFLVSPHNQFIWAGGLAFAAFSFWYEMRLHHEAESRLDFSVTRVVSGSVSIMIYGLLLLLAFNIYSKVQTSFRQNPDEFYDRLGQQAAATVPYFTKGIPSGTNLNEPFSQYLSDQAQANDPEYRQASPFEKQVIEQQVKSAFQNQFQIVANDNQSLADVMAQVAVNKIKDAAQPYQKYLPLIFTIIIIGLLYTFIFLIRWAVILISWLLFQLLTAFGFFKYEKVMVEVKKLII